MFLDRSRSFAWMGALLFAAAMTAAAWATTSAIDAATASRDLAGSTIQAQLKTKVDSAHAKVGQSVDARTVKTVKYEGTVVLPKGSRLVGQVVSVNPATSSQGATLSVQFTQAITPDGVQIPLQAGISGFLSTFNDVGESIAPMPNDVTVNTDAGSGSSTISRNHGDFTIQSGQMVSVQNAASRG